MNLLQQDVVKLPELELYSTLVGRKLSKLPDNGTIIVQGHRQKPYPVKLTRKTKYNRKELVPEWNPGAKYTAMIDTESQPWTVHSIEKVNEIPERTQDELKEEYEALTGDY